MPTISTAATGEFDEQTRPDRGHLNSDRDFQGDDRPLAGQSDLDHPERGRPRRGGEIEWLRDLRENQFGSAYRPQSTDWRTNQDTLDLQAQAHTWFRVQGSGE